MNLDNDYDNDGNNIVPCPICLSAHCPSKEGGKCPDEDEFAASFDLPDVSGGAKAKPRIHNAGESTCVSCEG